MLYIFVTLLAFSGMELVAWFTHKYVMHGLLWNLHQDHHVKDASHFFEKNDFFFLLFATPGIALLIAGIFGPWTVLAFIGLGISLYGLAYFVIHDLFIHQRIKVFRNTKNSYLKAVRKAHRAHHRHVQAEGGECFGMLTFPIHFLREQGKRK